MNSKKRIALLLVSFLLVSFCFMFSPLSVAAEVEKQNWKSYDELIKAIKTEVDFVKREALMHEAEDMLMETGAVCPIYYYNSSYMAKEGLKDYLCNPYEIKYFAFSEYGDRTILNVNLSSEPECLDPPRNTTVDGNSLVVNSFAGLFTYRDKNEIVPDLAESYEVSEDGKVYTFHLLPDLKWSDGSKLDANDFVYSWKRAVNFLTAADKAYIFNVIEGYQDLPEEYLSKEDGTPGKEIDEDFANEMADKLMVEASEDGQTLTVTLKVPCAYFLDLCAFPCFFPVQKAAVEAAEGFRNDDGKIVQPGAWGLEAGFPSNGPFTLKEWKHNESMIYVKNPNYHRADEVKINELHLMLSDDAAAVFAAYQAGDLDFINGIPSDEVPRMIEEKNPEFHTTSLLGTYFVVFNVKSEIFDGKTLEQAKAMRKAFSLLIDRQYVVDAVTQAGQIPATTFLPEGMSDGHGGMFRENDAEYQYPNAEEKGYFSLTPDVDKAIELLKEAGFEFDGDQLSSNTPLNLNYLTNKSEGHQKIAELIQQDLSVLGITMTIEQMDWATFINERAAGNFMVARAGIVADYNDPINLLELFTSDSGMNDPQLGK